MPVAFWYFSIGGGLMLLAYAIYRRDPVFILGPVAGRVHLCPQPLADPCRAPHASDPERKRGAAGSTPVLLMVLAVTALRVVALAFDRTDLFVDESQYWLWGQDLAFGYYSKPPLIGWVIRAVTTLAGPTRRSASGCRRRWPMRRRRVLLAADARRSSPGGARRSWVAAGYLTLPMVGVGSLLITTDTIMFPFLALALWAWLRGAARRRRRRRAALAGRGSALGLASWRNTPRSTYILGAALAALVAPEARPGWRAAGSRWAWRSCASLPNILWNAVNGWPTLHHTADNIDWVQRRRSGGPGCTRRAGAHFWQRSSAYSAR